MRVVTLNMWGRAGPWAMRWRVAASQLARLEVDVLCLQEVPDLALLGRLAGATGMRVVGAEVTTLSLAVLTRQTEAWSAGASDFNALPYSFCSPFEPHPRGFCVARLNGLDVVNTHLSWRRDDAESRRAQAAELAARFADRTVVLCGDFNCEPDAEELSPLVSAGFADTAAGTPAAYRPTWDNRNPFTAPFRDEYPDMRIDLVLASAPAATVLSVTDAAVVLDVPEACHASDHFGLMVDFRPSAR